MKIVKDVVFDKSDKVEIVFDDDTRNGVDLTNQKFPIDSKVINAIKKILTQWGNKKTELATSFVNSDRQSLGFLNELVDLAFYVAQNSAWFNLINVANAEGLMHSRVVAQLLFEYDKLGHKVTIEPPSYAQKNHDLNVDEFNCEVKTILPLKNLEIAQQGFKLPDEDFNWLQEKIIKKFNQAKSQLAQKGIVVIAPWSYNVNGILRSHFKNTLTESVPTPTNNIVILVLYGGKPFEYYYQKFSFKDYKSDITRALLEIQKGVKGTIQPQTHPFTLTTAAKKGSSASISFNIPFYLPKGSKSNKSQKRK